MISYNIDGELLQSDEALDTSREQGQEVLNLKIVLFD